MLKNIGSKAAGLISGVVMAGAVVVCSFSLVRLSFRFFPGWQLEQMPWAEWLTVIVIPETIFVIAAVALWRKRKTVVAGILLGALTLITHFIVHVATHG